MNVKILRIKQVGANFSVLVSSSGVERGFTYPAGEGWEDDIDGEPKYIQHIIRELMKQENAVKTIAGKIGKMKAEHEGKTFKEKAKAK